MKVICQMQLIVAFLVLSVFVSDCYAILVERAEQKQKEQNQAEVNGKKNSTQTRVRFKQYTNKTLVSRRRHNSDRQHPPSAQVVVAQHKIPIVHKVQAEYFPNTSSNDSVLSSHKRGQQKFQQSLRQPTKSTAKSVARVSQTQLLGLRASNSNIKDVHVSSNEVNNTKQVNGATSGLVATSTSGRSSVSTSILTTSTSHPFFSSNFQISNPFDLIPQIFGNLSRAISPAASSRKPPKKYKSSSSTTPTPVISTQFEEKRSYQKSQLEKVPLKATMLPIEDYKAQSNDGPFRIALPTVNFFNPSITKEMKSDFDKEKGKRATLQSLRERFVCPRESEVRFQLFPKICKIDKDCRIWNRDELCCEIFGASSCVSGIPKPLEETSHMPILGVIPRKCPTRPLAELWWDVQECETDNDCWPRVCCPDGRRRYCRTSQPELETVPLPVKRSFNYLTEYLECTAPPPPIFDLHPKACTSTFDCFPNVCCQEAGMRHCRPPKKSVLTLMANFFNVDFVKRLTQNIVIK